MKREKCGATGKVIFETKAEVKAALVQTYGRGVRRFHRCAFCNFWHRTKGAHNHGGGSSWHSA
jgi:hypothetical protein